MHCQEEATLSSLSNSDSTCNETSFGYGPVAERRSNVIVVISPSVRNQHGVLLLVIKSYSS